MSFGEREKEGFEGFLKIEMKNPRIRIKEIVLLVSLEKEKIKNWRVFGNRNSGNEGSESLGMKRVVLLVFLEKEKIKNWRVWR